MSGLRRDRRWAPRALCAVALAAAGAGTASTAAAQSTAPGRFGDPVAISAAGQHAFGAHVAVDGRGGVLAAWLRSDGESVRVQVAERSREGDFGAPADLSAAGRDATGVQVALDADGDAIATWCQSDGSRTRLYAALRRAGGDFTAPGPISPPDVAARDCDRPTWGLPQIAFGPSGDALAAWSAVPAGAADPDLAEHRVQTAQLPPGGDAFGAAQAVSAAGWSARNPQVAFDPTGAATLLWRAARSGTYFRIQAATRPPGGAFGAVQELSDPVSHAELQRIAIDPAGNAVAVWNRVRHFGSAVEVAVRPAGGRFGAVQELSTPIPAPSYVPPTVHLGGPARVAVDARGTAIVVWSELDGGRKRVFAAVRPAGGAFGPRQALSAPGKTAGAARVAFDGAGNAFAVWRRRSDTRRRFRIEAAVRPAGGAFGPAQSLSADGQRARAPQLAVDPDGHAVILWRRFDGAHWRIETARSTPAAAPAPR